MATTRTLHLITSRNSSKQRAHFGIFVPSGADPDTGTVIHVVGAPMAGYMLEFKRNYSPTKAAAEEGQQHEIIYPIGEVSASNIVDSTDNEQSRDNSPRDTLEREAAMVPPPRISENFRAPVNNVSEVVEHHHHVLQSVPASLTD